MQPSPDLFEDYKAGGGKQRKSTKPTAHKSLAQKQRFQIQQNLQVRTNLQITCVQHTHKKIFKILKDNKRQMTEESLKSKKSSACVHLSRNTRQCS